MEGTIGCVYGDVSTAGFCLFASYDVCSDSVVWRAISPDGKFAVGIGENPELTKAAVSLTGAMHGVAKPQDQGYTDQP